MSHGRHAAPTTPVITKNRLAATGALVGAAAGAGSGLLAEPAHASTVHDWSGVANCESTGNWHIDTGNGFYGGLQFTESTWLAFGGGAYASRADLATPAQQVTVAERTLASQGPNAWPHCHIFLRNGTTPATTDNTVVVKAAPARHSAPTHISETAAAHHTVVRGDTLWRLAQHYRTTVMALYNANRDHIHDPNWIYPGQVLRLPGHSVISAAVGGASPVAQKTTASHIPAPRPPVHASAVEDPLPGHVISSHTTTPGIQEVDLAAPMRTPIYSATSGTVEFAKGYGVRGFGGWIVVSSIIDGHRYDFVYGHEFTSGILVHPGEVVRAGEQLGNVGANGNATGPHVCFWIWSGGIIGGHPIDPVPFMAAHGVHL